MSLQGRAILAGVARVAGVTSAAATLACALLLLLAGGCASLIGPPYEPTSPPPAPAPHTTPAPTPTPPPAQPPPAPAPPQPTPAPPPTSKEFHLGPAAAALVQLAQQEAARGNPQLAQATVERALRIEPENPLLWIMLGEAHEAGGQYELAGGIGRKALQLASGDSHTQARAWRLIGDSLRARGQNEQANDAYSHADTLAAQ